MITWKKKKGLLSIQRLFEARLVLKTRQARWHAPVVPVTEETQTEEWLEPKNSRPDKTTQHEFVLQIYLKQKTKSKTKTNKQETLKGLGVVEHSYNSKTLEVKAGDQQFKAKLSNEVSSGPAGLC